VLAADHSMDLVLADVGMSRMNGRASAREVRVRYPSVRLGLITRYGEAGPPVPAECTLVDLIITNPSPSLRVITSHRQEPARHHFSPTSPRVITSRRT